MNKKIDYKYQWIGILFLIILWIISSKIVDNNQVLPTFSSVFISLLNLFKTSSTYRAFSYTFLRTIIAIIISIFLGIIIGLISALNIKFKSFITPIIKLLRFVPIPCFIILLYSTFLSKPNFSSILISFITIFPIIYQSIVDGVDNIDKNIINSLKIEGLYKFNSIKNVIFPLTFPYLCLGIINSIGLGIKVSVMSEIIIGSNQIWGIGRLIYSAQVDGDNSKLFAIIILILLIFIFFDLLSQKIIKKISK